MSRHTTKENTNTKKGISALLLLTIVYATMPIWARYLAGSFAIFQQVYLRMFVAFLFSLIFFHRSLLRAKWREVKKREWLLLILRGSVAGLSIVLYSVAAINTKLGNVSLISSLPFVVIFGVIFFKEKLTLAKCALLLLSLVGVTLIAVPDLHNLLHWGMGELYALASAVGFGFMYASRKWHTKTLGDFEISTVMFLFMVVVTLIGSVLYGEGVPNFNMSLTLWVILLIAGVFNTLNLNLSNYGFSKVSNILAGNILMLEVFWAIIFGFVLFRETMLPREIIGGALIITSVVVMNKLTNKEASANEV